MTNTRAAVLRLSLAIVLTLGASVGGAQHDAPPRFPLVFHVARSPAGRALVTDAEIAARVEETSALFARASIGFHVHEVRALRPEHATLETIRERRALRRYLRPRVINVFVVDNIEDPNPSAATLRAAAAQGRAPTGRISGAHIPSGRRRVPETYIVLSRWRSLWSLPHELGHFFGAPHHRDPNNIMSYGFGRRDFDERQIRTFRRRARRLVRQRVLRPILTAPR